MLSAVFFWNNACPAFTSSPNRRPMVRPIPNCTKHNRKVATAIVSNSITEALLCTIFFTVIPVVILNEMDQK